MTTATAPQTDVPQENALTALDRCDGCSSAAAQVRVTKGESTLLFCGHHFSKQSVALGLGGWTVSEDIREAQ